MNPNEPLLTNTLSPTEVIEINRICDRLEADWRSGRRPTIEDLVASAKEPLRSALLKELLATELECRRLAGEHPRLAEYTARFPDRVAIIEAAFGHLDERHPAPSKNAQNSTRSAGTGGVGRIRP